MSQEGYLMRWNVNTGERKDIRPPAPAGGTKPVSTGTPDLPWISRMERFITVASTFISRPSRNSWTIISPDLTSNNPEWQKQAQSGGLTLDVTGAENFTTIIAIAISPKDRNTIWAGTDDGRLHVTHDGGQNWNSVEKNVKEFR